MTAYAELLKLGFAGAALIVSLLIVKEGLAIVRMRFEKGPKPTDYMSAGEMPREHYDNRFDRIDGVLATQTGILQTLTSIVADLKDMFKEFIIRDEERRKNGAA